MACVHLSQTEIMFFFFDFASLFFFFFLFLLIFFFVFSFWCAEEMTGKKNKEWFYEIITFHHLNLLFKKNKINSRQSNHYTGFKAIKKLKQSNSQHRDILSKKNTLYPLRRRKPMNVQNRRHLNTQNTEFPSY